MATVTDALKRAADEMERLNERCSECGQIKIKAVVLSDENGKLWYSKREQA